MQDISFKPVFWFVRLFSNFKIYVFKPYDPTWLISAAMKEFPENLSLHEALKKCTRASGVIPYIHFVSSKNANRPGAEWQFKENVILEDTIHGEVVLDILKDGRVGGVEFLSHL